MNGTHPTPLMGTGGFPKERAPARLASRKGPVAHTQMVRFGTETILGGHGLYVKPRAVPVAPKNKSLGIVTHRTSGHDVGASPRTVSDMGLPSTG